MKKYLSLALAALLLISIAGCATAGSPAGTTVAGITAASTQPQTRLDKIKAAGKIIMATSPDFAPLEFIDHTKTGQAQYVGSDIELGKYIAEQLGVELIVEAMDFAAVQAAVSTGAVDIAISGMAWKEDRAASMELSIFFNNTEGTQGIIVPAAKASEYKTAEDFAGKKLAAQNGSLQWELAEKQLPDDIILEPIASLGDAVMMLLTGKVDAIVSAYSSGELLIKNAPELQMSEFLFAYDSDGNVLGAPKGETELMAAINEILEKVNSEGLYDQWRTDAEQLAKDLGLDG